MHCADYLQLSDDVVKSVKDVWIQDADTNMAEFKRWAELDDFLIIKNEKQRECATTIYKNRLSCFVESGSSLASLAVPFVNDGNRKRQLIVLAADPNASVDEVLRYLWVEEMFSTMESVFNEHESELDTEVD